MKESENTWLDPVAEVAASINGCVDGDKPAPITFVLGAGASISSRGPKTTDILAECRRKWPGKFSSDEEVYEKFTELLTPGERESLMRPLFAPIAAPYVGYRCLAAMARSRPVYVVNLNWDDCVERAGKLVGVPVRSFDVRDVAEGKRAIEAVLRKRRGIACAHLHGFLDNPNKEHGISFRFAYSDTKSFEAGERTLLRKLLEPLTIVAGTSLEGPRDIPEILQALIPAKREKAKPLWIFERGAHRPRSVAERRTKVDPSLFEALVVRHSMDHYVSNPDIDFDTMLAQLRSAEAELPWKDVEEEAEGRLPPLHEVVPPNPDEVRPMLDSNRALIVGAPRVGASTVAYLVAWWRSLTDVHTGPLRVMGLHRPEEALKLLSGKVDDDIGAIVLDDLFDERDRKDDETESLRDELAAALGKLDDGKVVIATASPDGTTAAMCGTLKHKDAKRPRPARHGSPLASMLDQIVVQAGTLWRQSDLRAWARARGGEHAELVCREIRMGLITTPSQAMRRLSGQTPYELEPSWSRRLRAHIDEVCKHNKQEALLLTMLRLQDFWIPRPAKSLSTLSGAPIETVAGDPWGLSTLIKVDGEFYLRLGHPGVVRVIDDWIEQNLDSLSADLTQLREKGHWTVVALERWRVYRGIGDGTEVPDDLPWADLELFGSEFVEHAIVHEKRPERAIEVLWRMWHCAPDHWSVKDVALDLVRHWEVLRKDERATPLRDQIVKDDARFGAYALLEALLRVGRPAALELWYPVTTRIADLARLSGSDPLARRQVALAFDAVLWRRCPVGREGTVKFIDILIEAAARDELLHAAFRAASAYHFDGAKRLRAEGFKPPVVNGTSVDLGEAREMAWLVAWHFVHQSRCRAVVSRRMFQSTLEAFVGSDAPRYLDRPRRQDPLDAEHEAAVVRVAEALAAHPETAGWGLHMIMNVHATSGSFDLPEGLSARLSETLDRESPDPGVVSAALTYMPAPATRALIEPILQGDGDRGSQALQSGLGKGVRVEITGAGAATMVVEPRFAMSADPMRTRKRWGAGPERLPGGHTPESLIECLAQAVDIAVANKKVERPVAERALARMRRGETWAIEALARGRNLDSEDGYVALLVGACKALEADADD